MAATQAGIEGLNQEKPKESLSQFTAKVLDQLSISAWLPAGALVLGGLLIANLRITNGDLEQAFTRAANLSLTGLILLLISVVLATMLTQAFSFGAIRLLEGYWGEGLLRSRVHEYCCRRHLWVRRRLYARRERLLRHAFDTARVELLKMGWSRRQLDTIEYQEFGLGGFKAGEEPSDEELEEVDELDWEDHADGAAMRRIEALSQRLKEYPELERRTMPTRLGNTMRSAEQDAFPGESDLEGRIIRVFDQLPIALQSQHDDHRNRLDLYASLVLLSVFLGAVSALALHTYDPALRWCLGLAAASAWISYRAALASARGYGTVLRAVSKREQEERASQPVD